jgi:heat shock protein HslJ
LMSRPSSMRYAALGILLAAVLAAVGCAGRSDQVEPGEGPTIAPSTADPDPLHGRTFTSTVITEQGQPRALVAGTTIELRFTDDGRLVANAGCNTISGRITVAGDRLDLTDPSITEMGCDPQRHEQDQFLSAFLASNPSWRWDGGNLVLSSAGTDMVFTQEKALPLIGTTWKADTLIYGDVVGSTPAGVGATFVFGQDEVTISGLCNLGAVKYRASGSTLTFELGPMTRMACAPEIMTVEQAAVTLFDGATTYRIDPKTLTITKADKGMRFTAAS